MLIARFDNFLHSQEYSTEQVLHPIDRLLVCLINPERGLFWIGAVQSLDVFINRLVGWHPLYVRSYPSSSLYLSILTYFAQSFYIPVDKFLHHLLMHFVYSDDCDWPSDDTVGEDQLVSKHGCQLPPPELAIFSVFLQINNSPRLRISIFPTRFLNEAGTNLSLVNERSSICRFDYTFLPIVSGVSVSRLSET